MIAVAPVYWCFIVMGLLGLGINVGYRFGYRDGKMDERLRADDVMRDILSDWVEKRHEPDPAS